MASGLEGIGVMGSDDWMVIEGHVLEVLHELPDASVQTCITSPPYLGLRDYGIEPVIWGGDDGCDHTPVTSAETGTCERCGAWRGQLGHEATPDEFVTHLADVFEEVRRVLRDDGTLWVNLGDSYNGSGPAGGGLTHPGGHARWPGLKQKDLVGVPWLFAFEMRRRGWFLRADVIWAKPNPMPEPVTDRPVRSHEYLFLLTKSARYFYDYHAVREPLKSSPEAYLSKNHIGQKHKTIGGRPIRSLSFASVPSGRNLRDVWTIAPESYAEAHFATFPSRLVEPCVKAGTSEKGACANCGAPLRRILEPSISTADVDEAEYLTKGWEPSCECFDGALEAQTVFDPFSGSGTTGMVARRLGRRYIGVEISPEYAAMSRRRIEEEGEGIRRTYDDAGDVMAEQVRLL